MLFIATSNSIASLPPELRRRFTLGTFFFAGAVGRDRRAAGETCTVLLEEEN
jgi:hypothetical protein